MEPLTVFSFVVNVVQLVDFTVRLLKEANEIYHSGTGHSAEQVELKKVAEDLSRLCDNVPSIPADEQDHVLGQLGREISEIATLIKKEAKDLITAIQKLKLKYGSSRHWGSFRQALATIWHRKEIDKMHNRLKGLRNDLQANMITYMKVQTEGIVKTLDSLKTEFEKMKCQRVDSIGRLNSLVKNMSISQLSKENLFDVERRLNEYHALREKYAREQEVLENLQFTAMFDRYHAIPEAHLKTFEWIFHPNLFPQTDPRSTVAFKQWLLSDNGVFWVCGKPGSGKSTLMRYLCDCQQTKQYLTTWAGKDRLVAVSFYFWTAGSELQRSQRGLLRHLLFEILREHPDLTEILFTDKDKYPHVSLSLPDLYSALQRLKSLPSTTKFCFFLDGLDEYGGDHQDIINTINKLARIPNIKLCVSSRRHVEFEDAFGTDPNRKLHLEQLTRDDIAKFARDKFEETTQFRKAVQQVDSDFDIVAEITRKAEGVFLWVFLVVRSLRNGLVKGDNMSLMRKRLDELPSDLQKLFENIIASVDSVYRRRMATTLQVALRAPEPVNLVTYWLLDEEKGWTGSKFELEESIGTVQAIEGEMSRRLYGRYLGLLEATGTLGTQRVNFIHRTVRDYLDSEAARNIFAFPDLNSYSKACKALIAYLSIYGSNGTYTNTSLEHFVIFSKWAEIQNENFDIDIFSKMNQVAIERFGSNQVRFLRELVHYGCVSGLEYLFSRDPELLTHHGRFLLLTALEAQPYMAKRLFGPALVERVLNWLFSKSSRVVLQALSELFPEFFLGVLGEDLGYQNSYLPGYNMEPEEWKTTLNVLLRHGADIIHVLRDRRFIRDLPWLRFSERFFTDMSHALRSVPNREQIRESMRDLLDRCTELYSTFLEYGFDPNVPLDARTVWQMWLWQICDFQVNHGLFETQSLRLMQVFLSSGADPYASVSYQSDRLKEVKISVEHIVDGLFGEESRRVLYPVLEEAKRGWREAHARGLNRAPSRRKRRGENQVRCSPWHHNKRPRL
ncbi:hypothetical protein CC78DRAFT_618133 [Lojkania enalia]|uniref:NACHT domain-containing protein n=1 Tax=Lojkania enalia TaxID=147567 RepID=A0A9P4KBB0_9PLEO|nr:hypothetical protein CC78DRAFT_618133 [Didymosphaeria enalia]